MAEQDQTRHRYDVFIVHSSDDETIARQINESLKESGLKTYVHFQSSEEADGFFAGKFVLDNITYAVKNSKTVLILVTENALKSSWVTFEIILSIEKSFQQDSLCLRLVFQGISDEEIRLFKTGDLEYIPDFVLDLQIETWKSDLVAKIKEPNPKLKDVLPVGNVAHGLVFNYFAGFLRHVLPNLKAALQECVYYQEHKMLQKFILVIPASCCCMKIDGEFGDVVIKKMKDNIEIRATHGDKHRPYNLSVYSITKGQKSYYFTGECPFIIETMHKITRFAKVGPTFLKYQVERFRKTLQELVNHRGNLHCNNTACFVNIDDTAVDKDTIFADTIWEAVENACEEEARMSETSDTKTVRKVGTMVKQSDTDKKYFATVTHQESESDMRTAKNIFEFLTDKDVKFTNGNGKMQIKVLEEAQWNIFVLSKETITNDLLLTQLNSAFQKSVDNDVVQVIPIVSKETSIKDIPEQIKCATLLQEEEDGSHLQRMWDMMQGTPRTMKESLPSGPVHQGLAYAYMVNYLAIALDGKTAEGKGFRERFEDAVQKYKVSSPCVPRVFLITAESCSFPPSGTQFRNERHVGELEPAIVGVRKYDLQLYELTMKDGKRVCYAREYTTPAVSLHEMAHKYPFAGMNTEDMKVQAQEFVKLCAKIIQDENFKMHLGDIKDKCVLIYFNDSVEDMPEAVEREIQQYLDEGVYIAPQETT